MAAGYLVIIERADTNFAAYSPDLPGCAATGRTRDEAVDNMRGVIALHLEGLQADGEPIPEPRTTAEYVAA